MRIPALTLLISTLALAACAGHPSSESESPYLAAPVREVSNEEQGQYWVLDGSSLMRSHSDAAPTDGCFRARVLIDSNGRLFEPKLLATVGSSAFSDWIPGFLAHLRYNAAKENPGMAPIRTILSLTFSKTFIRPPDASTASARALAAAVAADAAKAPPPGALDWYEKCAAEMDKQTGAAPAAATTAH